MASGADASGPLQGRCRTERTVLPARQGASDQLHAADGERAAAARAAAASGGAPPRLGMVPKGGGFLQGPGAPAILPAWITESDVDFYAAEFRRTGFTGALNWYRNFDRNWELQGSLQGAPVTVPALYVAGDRVFVAPPPPMSKLLPNPTRFRSVC